MGLMSTQSTNQWFQKTCVTNIFVLACLLTAEAMAKQQPGFARQLFDKREANDDYSSSSNLYHQPHFTGNRSVIVQLFEWKFLDIAEECRTFLGPQGYAGVQLSPVLEHTLVKSSSLSHPWWERYEVISYRLASRSGDESEFWAMSRICNDNGVRIYADVVLNHMAAPLHLLDSSMTNNDFIVDTLLEQNVNISQLNYPNVSYTQQDFHRPCNIGNTQDAYEIRNCQLNGHPDLDHSLAAVQEHIVEMLNKFIDMGVAGFRIDAAKHIWPITLKNLFEQVDDLNEDFNFAKHTRPFLYQDVFDFGLDSVSKTEYTTNGVVSEYLYPAELATILNGKAPLSSLINWGPAMGFLSHQDSLVFIDSPDTQRGLPIQLGRNYMLTYKQRIKYIMANAFMLAHPYGNIKRIMSSYYYAEMDINQGPPVEEESDEPTIIRSPQFNAQQQCTIDSGWVCEHRWPSLVNMMKVANYFRVLGQKEESIIYFQTNGPNQIAFCRGYKLFMAMNNDPELDFAKEIYTCMEPGIYCDIITGGRNEDEQTCHGRQLEVNEQGYAQLVLMAADAYTDDGNDVGEEGEEPQKANSYGVLVVYVGSKISPKLGLEDSLKTEEQIENVDVPDSGTTDDNIEDLEGNEDVNIDEAVDGNNDLEGDETIDQPEADDEVNTETPADSVAEDESDVIKEAAEENETPENETDETENQLEANNEENDEIQTDDTDEMTPADGNSQEADAKKEAAEENETPENETDETENQLEANNEEIDEIQADDTDAMTLADGNSQEADAEKEAAEENETPENETDETENQLEANNEEIDEIQTDDTDEMTPADENSQEDDAEFPLVSELEENPVEAENLLEIPEHDNLPHEEQSTPEESSKEIETPEENDTPEQNQPKDIDEIEQQPEEVLEKPSADIVDDLNKKTENGQNIKMAGFLSKSPKDFLSNG